MPIPRKPSPANSLSLVGQIQPLPPIPKDIQDKFESMATYQEEMDRWWNRFGELFQRDLDSIATQFQADELAASNLKQQVADLTAKVAKLTGS